MHITLGLVNRDRLLNQVRGGVGITRIAGHHARAAKQLGFLQRPFGKLRRLLEVALRLGGSGKRSRSLTRTDESQSGPFLDCDRILGIRV